MDLNKVAKPPAKRSLRWFSSLVCLLLPFVVSCGEDPEPRTPRIVRLLPEWGLPPKPDQGEVVLAWGEDFADTWRPRGLTGFDTATPTTSPEAEWRPTESGGYLESPGDLLLSMDRLEEFVVSLRATGCERVHLVWDDARGVAKRELEELGGYGPRASYLTQSMSFRVSSEGRVLRVLPRGAWKRRRPAPEIDRLFLVPQWSEDGDRSLAIAGIDVLGKVVHEGGVQDRVTLSGELRDAAVVPAGIELTARAPRGATELTLAVAFSGPEKSVRFEVAVRTLGGETVLHEVEASRPGRWFAANLDLSGIARNTELVFRTNASEGTTCHWGTPLVRVGSPDLDPVVLYEIDTLRADVLGTYGFPGPASPTIDRWARRGVLFQECTAPSTWTRPTAASVLTGRSPLAHGVVHERDRLPEDEVTWAETMREMGYFTVAVVTNPNAGPPANADQGFDLVVDSDALFNMRHELPDFPIDRIRSNSSPSGTSEMIFLYLERWLPDFVDWPIFLYLHPNDPHAPYAPQKPLDSRPGLTRNYFGKAAGVGYRNYVGDVLAADVQLSRITRLFESLGLDESMHFCLIADHGEEFREHRRQGHGVDLYVETLQVPLVVRSPDVPGGHVVSARVSAMDLFPTVLDLLGHEGLEGLEGASRARWMRGGKPRTDEPDAFRFAHLLNLRMRLRDEVMADSSVVGEVAVFRGPWKLIWKDYGRHGKVDTLLFHRELDPAEIVDLSADEPELARELLDEARAWVDTPRRSREGEDTVVDSDTSDQLRALGYVD